MISTYSHGTRDVGWLNLSKPCRPSSLRVILLMFLVAIAFGALIVSAQVCTVEKCKGSDTFVTSGNSYRCSSSSSSSQCRFVRHHYTFINSSNGSRVGTGCYCDRACTRFKDCCNDVIGSCDQMEIHRITPLSSDTEGGGWINVYGVSFNNTVVQYDRDLFRNQYDHTVTFNGVEQSINMSTRTRTFFSFRVPPGVGTGHQIQTVYDQSARSSSLGPYNIAEPAFTKRSNVVTFDYNPPSITVSSVPTTIPTFGRTQITIRGNNFGAFPDQITCFLGTQQLSVSSLTHKSFVVNFPPGLSKNNNFYVVVAGQTSNSVFVNYESILTTSLSPASGPTQGNSNPTALTITGKAFGASNFKVFFGSASIACTVNSDHTVLRCPIPPGHGRMSVRVQNGLGDFSTQSLYYTFNDPIITSFTPSTLPTQGGLLTLTGENFYTNALVTIGGVPCTFDTSGTVTPNHTGAVCNVAAGIGEGYDVKVQVGLVQYTSPNPFSYQPPTITGITPLTGPTTGENYLTITGTNFGANNAEISMKGVKTTIVSRTHHQAIVVVPAGQGMNIPIQLTVARRSVNAAQTYSYLPPVVSSITPSTTDTNGVTIVTVRGSNFGTNGLINIGESACVPVSNGFSHTTIRCQVQPGTGRNKKVLVTVDSQASNDDVVFHYKPPVITSITPPALPTEGGSSITLAGSSFGLSSGKVLVDGAEDACIITLQTHSTVVCTLPPLVTTSSLSVSIGYVVGGQSTAESMSYSYGRPVINHITPTGLGSVGGDLITISGTSFTTSPNDSNDYISVGGQPCATSSWTHTQIICTLPISSKFSSAVVLHTRRDGTSYNSNTLYYTYARPVLQTITPSIISTDGSQTVTLVGQNLNILQDGGKAQIVAGDTICRNPILVEDSHHTTVTCQPSPGVGLNNDIYLQFLDVQLTASTSLLTTIDSNRLKYSFDVPTLTQISPASGPTQGGETITLTGANFGPESSLNSIAVSFGTQICTDLAWQSHSQISCTIPPGSRSVQVHVTAGNAISNSLIYTYDPPVITAISPRNGPTQGENSITLTGTSFDANPSVTVAGASCRDVQVNASHTSLTCIIPAGQGIDKSVTVIVTGQSSNEMLYSYDPPAIDTVTPLVADTVSGTDITLTGSNFGLNAQVFVGGEVCVAKTHTHEQITCTVPPGQGKDLPISIDVDIFSATSPVVFSFNPPAIHEVLLDGLQQPLPTQGNYPITIIGQNFGTFGEVLIAGKQCFSTDSGFSHTQIVCILPEASNLQSTTAPISISISGQTTLGEITYAPPLITSISPISGPTEGGFFITLTGTSFGQGSQATHTVSIGSLGCDLNDPTDWSHTQIICQVPVGNGEDLPVSVTTTTGEYTLPSPTFSYDLPHVAIASPDTIPTAGGVIVTITGTSFDIYGPQSTAYIDDTECIVDLDNPELNTYWGSNEIRCVSPAGTGQDLSIRIRRRDGRESGRDGVISYEPPLITSIAIDSIHNNNAGQTRGDNTVTITGSSFGSDPATTQVLIGTRVCTSPAVSDREIVCTYPPGTGQAILTVTIRGQRSNEIFFTYDSPRLATPDTPLTGFTQGGDLITIRGHNLSIQSFSEPLRPQDAIQSYVQVTIAGSPCEFISVTLSPPPATISDYDVYVCRVPEGAGTNRPLLANLDGQFSNQITFAYRAPVITSVTPSSDIPTTFGQLITLTGDSFGMVPAPIYIGMSSCLVDGNTPETSWGHQSIVCQAQAGEGKDLPLMFSVSTLQSNTMLVHRAAPVIDTISPRSGTSAGGNTLTILGSNFGSMGSARMITIGGSPCTSLSTAPEVSHTRLTCTIPPGNGADLDVIVTVASQESTPTQDTRYSYSGPTIQSVSPALPTTGGTLTITGSSFTPGSVVTIDGSHPCAVTSVSADGTQILCTAPAGLGTQLPVVVVSSTLVSICGADDPDDCLFSYLPPVITNVRPTLIPTQSEDIALTISGANFGPSPAPINAVVQIGPYQCRVSYWNHNSIECFVTQGTGVSHSVTVTINDTPYPATPAVPMVSFRPPSITSVTSSGTYPAVGGTTITIAGTNFGHDQSRVQVVFNDDSTAALNIQSFVPHSTVVGTLQPNIGAIPIAIIVDGQRSIPYTIQYDPPILTSVTGCTPNMGTATHCEMDGGAPLVITGKNVCRPNQDASDFSAIQVVLQFVSGSTVTSVPLPISSINCSSEDNIINTTAPEFLGGQLTHLRLSVEVHGRTGHLANAISYGGPAILPNTIIAQGGQTTPSSSVDGLLTASGASSVSFLATNLAGVDTLTSVKYGPVEDPLRYTCLSHTVSSDCQSYAPESGSCYLVQCTLSGGVGHSHYFTLFATIVLSSSNVEVISGQGTDTIAFTPPLFHPTSLQLTSTPATALPDVDCAATDCSSPYFVQGRVVDGQYIQMKVSHVHVNQQYVSLNYGLGSSQPFRLLADSDDAFPMRCTDVKIFPLSGEDAYITCRLSVGSGKPYVFQVTTYNTQSTVSTDEYHYPDAPQIISVKGCDIDDTESTQGCPTRGGTTLTIQGIQFGDESSTQTVYVGSEICQVLTYTPADGTGLDTIECILPPGAGEQTVSVAVGELWSSAVPWVTYHPPVITSISADAAYCDPDSSLSLVNCQREADAAYTITIQGEFFGPSSPTTSAYVFVGGLTCTNVIHSVGKEHEEVVCQVPENRGQNMTILLLQAASSVPSQNTATLSYVSCKPGYYNRFDTVTCEPCAPGEYTDIEESYLPTACPAGTFTADIASTSCANCAIGTFSPSGATQCTDCSPGTYAPTAGSAICLDCSPGTFAASPKQGICEPCAVGHSQPLSGQATCLPCTAGSFQPTVGKASCQLCVQGRFQPATGQSVCEVCSPGSFQDQAGQTACIPCPQGQAQINSGQARCENCGSGYFSDTTGAEVCSICPQGHFSVNLDVNNTGPIECEACLPGFYQPSTGQSTCLSCSPGSFSASNAQTQCTSCPIAHYQSQSQQTACEPCPAGTFTNVLGTIVCSDCLPGRFNDATGQSSCQLCPIGTYADSPGAVECTDCEAGRYNDALGQAFCPQCNSGTFTDAVRQSSCAPCPAGHYNQQDPNDVSSTASCLDCPIGSHTDSLGSDSCPACPSGSVASTAGTVLCTLCEPGTFADYTTHQCSLCPEGTFSNAYGAIACSPCLPGTFTDSTGSTQCADCAAGYHQPSSGQPACLECSPGSFSLEGASICTRCSPGTFNPDVHQDSCSLCPPGTFEPDSGQAVACGSCPDGYYTDATGSTSCQPCSPGTFTDSGMVKDRCEDCQPGTFSNSAAEQCEPCPAGFYNPVAGQSICLECPLGSFTDVEGQSECTPCPAGFHQDETGSTQCKICPDGHFSDGSGFVTCKACPIGHRSRNDEDVDRGADPDAVLIRDQCVLCTPGTFAPEEGLTVCVDCSPGRYTNMFGAFVCESCTAGTSQPLSGQSQCEDCTVGQYQDESGQSECKPCVVGTASSGTGQTRCADCLPGYYQDQTGQSHCLECSPGTFSSDIRSIECTECTPGTYQDNSAQSTCLDCPSGRFSTEPRQESCSECSPGMYQSETGQTECIPCAVGSSAIGYGTVMCTPCEPGSFSDVTGLTTCKKCEAGTANDAIGATECSQCLEGTYSSLPGAITCTQCEAGRYQSLAGQTLCADCRPGSYQPLKGQATCLPCAAGSFTSIAGRPVCSLCPLGHATDVEGSAACTSCSPGFSAGEEGLQTCASCQVGTYSSTHAAYECLACPPGRFSAETEQSTCSPCILGEYQSEFGQATCNKCAPGSFSDAEASIQCQRCPLGTYADEYGLEECISAPAGATHNADFTDFMLCAPGTHASTERSPRCSKCSPGTFASGEGNTTCTLCEPGFFSNSDGQEECMACPIGTFASVSGSTQCDPCPSGTYSNQPGSANCIPCPRGSYSFTDSLSSIGASSCVECQPGQYQSLTGQSSCIMCPIGQFSPTVAAEECTLCPPGQFSDAPGRSSCAKCAPGHYSPNPGSPTCNECQPGRYQELSGQPECLPCPPGFSQPESGQQECIQCDEGRFAPTSGSSLCSLCEPGTMGPAEYTVIDDATGEEVHKIRDTAECVPCQPGFYQDATGALTCKGCEIGWYSEAFGSTICQMCPPGSFTDAVNSATCTLCTPGMFQDLAGQSECKECQEGYFSGAEGQPLCSECPVGRFSNKPMTSVCENCPAGQFNSFTGQTECNDCPPGRFTTVGQASCSMCPDSTATELEKSSECVPCGVLAISSQDRTECLCKPGYFLPSFVAGSNEWNCIQCPTGADCRQVGTRWDNMSALPGYWRPSDTSYDFIRCPVAEQCVGGPAQAAQFQTDGSSGSACTTHRVGIACSSCDEGYRPAGTSCLKCQEGAPQYVVLAVLALVVLLLIILACYFIIRAGDEILRQAVDDTPQTTAPQPLSAPPPMVEMGRMHNIQNMTESGTTTATTTQTNENELETDEVDGSDSDDNSDDQLEQQESEEQNTFDQTLARIHAPPLPATNFTYKFKIIITFIQIAYSITTDLNFRWPKAYKNVFSFMGITSIDFLLESVTGADCFSKRNYYPLYFIYLIAPIIVLLLLLLLWVVPRETRLFGWRSLSTFGRMRSRIHSWRIILFFLFIVFPMCSSIVIRHFVCHNIEDEHFLMADYRVQCFDRTWNIVAFISIIFLLAYPIGIPAFIWFLINNYKHQLAQPRVKAQLGFLYAGYKGNMWAWELLDSFHKLILVAIIAFLPYSAQLQVAMCVIALYLILLLIFNPYIDATDDFLHQIAQIELLLLVIAGFMFESFKDRELTRLEDISLSVLLLVVTFGLILLFLYFTFFTIRQIYRVRKASKAQPPSNDEIEVSDDIDDNDSSDQSDDDSDHLDDQADQSDGDDDTENSAEIYNDDNDDGLSDEVDSPDQNSD